MKISTQLKQTTFVEWVCTAMSTASLLLAFFWLLLPTTTDNPAAARRERAIGRVAGYSAIGLGAFTVVTSIYGHPQRRRG